MVQNLEWDGKGSFVEWILKVKEIVNFEFLEFLLQGKFIIELCDV